LKYNNNNNNNNNNNMGLIKRQTKEERITIDEMDNNMDYIESFGVDDVLIESGNTITIKRVDNSELIFTLQPISKDKEIFKKKIVINDKVTQYKGIYYEEFTEPQTKLKIKFNIDEETENFIFNVNEDKSYFIDAVIGYFINGIFRTSLIKVGINKNVNYVNNGYSFNIGSGFNGGVNAITIQSDGKILVGGQFTSYNGTTRNRIIRLNSDGSIDSSFVEPNPSLNNGIIFSITTDSNDVIYCGGTFINQLNFGLMGDRIMSFYYNGLYNNSFLTGTGFSSSFDSNLVFVNQIEVQPDGKILVCGRFNTFKDSRSNCIVRINKNGTIDNTFLNTSGTGSSTSVVYSFKKLLNGDLLLVGEFTLFGGSSSSRLVLLNPNGSVKGRFSAFNATVFTMDIQSDGKIIVGGSFTTSFFTTRNRISRLSSTGNSNDSTFNIGTGFNDNVMVVKVQTDDKILVGGNFTTYNNITTNRIIRLNPDGSLDETFNIGSGFNGQVLTIALQLDGKILVGGEFTSYNGNPVNRIVRLNSDGTIDTLNTQNYKFFTPQFKVAFNQNVQSSFFRQSFIPEFTEEKELTLKFNPEPNGSVEKLVIDFNIIEYK
jgi:uncharacterized delta-60 repeat protein